MIMLFLYVLLGILTAALSQEQECNNNPSYVQKSADIHRNTVQALTNTTYRSQILNTPKLQDQHVYIYHIQGPKSREFILCSTPKAGSTRMNMLLKRILSPNDRGMYHNIYRDSRFNPIEWRSPEYVEKILKNSSIPRFIIVRNPYIRAISMYTDKIQRGEYRLNIGLGRRGEISFDTFVEVLYQRMINFKLEQNAKHIDRHFVPQSMHCGIDVGLNYNYILKQEEIDDWFDCFIDEINARDAVAHGWPDENSCYLSTTKNPCNGPRMENGVMKNIDEKTSEHHTGSQNLLAELYSNKTIAQMVAELYQVDIINFGYEFL